MYINIVFTYETDVFTYEIRRFFELTTLNLFNRGLAWNSKMKLISFYRMVFEFPKQLFFLFYLPSNIYN